jgi:hypothetical protein
VHQNLRHVFSVSLSNREVVGRSVGIRPAPATGLRVDKESVNGEQAVHACGGAGGGCLPWQEQPAILWMNASINHLQPNHDIYIFAKNSRMRNELE